MKGLCLDTWALVLLLTMRMRSTNQDLKGVHGEYKKVHCTCSLYLVVGQGQLSRSNIYGTSARKSRFKLHTGALLLLISPYLWDLSIILKSNNMLVLLK
ncbi:hypothetical protein BAE46_11705 [Glaciecola punicea]|nr:hypothetical protein BAE46_11705 [Glaciecola punicea]